MNLIYHKIEKNFNLTFNVSKATIQISGGQIT
jgi:hypothetical protein